MTHARDGKYYAKNGTVWKAPTEKKTENGSKISLGFPICKMHDAVGDEAADTVAELLNCGEQATAFVEALSDIRLLANSAGNPRTIIAKIFDIATQASRKSIPPSPQESPSE